ncbi:MAG: type I addiction module toxin, SymE family [Gammaproteobacteria bacterium]|nr:type I addiction module toxin, SymE family [Gammaproteobacteria bacterium]
MAKKHHKPESLSAKAKLPYPRRLKVHSGHYDYQSTINPSGYRKSAPVPWIQLKGYWLGQAGFPIGTELEVNISEQRVVITPASSDCTTLGYSGHKLSGQRRMGAGHCTHPVSARSERPAHGQVLRTRRPIRRTRRELR